MLGFVRGRPGTMSTLNGRRRGPPKGQNDTFLADIQLNGPGRKNFKELWTSFGHRSSLPIMAIELDVAAMGMGNGSGLPSNVRRRQTTIILPSLSPKKKDAHPFRHKQRISWFPLSLPTNIYYIFILALLSISMDGEREDDASDTNTYSDRERN